MSQALEGLRVIELGRYVATPFLGAQLARFGAEVIRVESRDAVDIWRSFPSPWIPGAIFPDFAAGKHIITLNLSMERGRGLLRELLRRSDALITNFREDMLGRWGADWESVHQANPRLVMIWQTGLGATGPYSKYKSYGNALQSMCGVMEMCGTPDSIMHTTSIYLDYHSPQYALVCLTGALLRRKRTGEGTLIEIPLFECGPASVGTVLLDFLNNGRAAHRIGNSHPLGAPHNVYPCRGDDRWVAISVFSDREWDAMCQAMGNPAWATDAELGSTLDRLRNREELDRRVAAWTRDRDAPEVMDLLQRHGVPAGVVAKGQDLVENPHLAARRVFQETPYYAFRDGQEEPAETSTLAMTLPARLSETPSQLGAVGRLGDGNEHVYESVLGMSKEEVEALAREGVLT